MLHRIKLKATFVFLLIHAGLAVALYALLKTRQVSGSNELFWTYAAGVALLYGGMVCGVLFVYLPAAPWIRRTQKVLSWKEWVMEELPELLVALPAIVAAIATFVKALQDLSKTAQAHQRPARPNGVKRRAKNGESKSSAA